MNAALFVGMSSHNTVYAQANLLQMNISGTVTAATLQPQNSAQPKNPQQILGGDLRQRALTEATKNAWRIMRTRPEFSSKVISLGIEQDLQMAQNLISRCTVHDLDQFLDQTNQMISYRFRFECDQQAIQNDIANVARQLAQASGAQNSEKPTLTFLFFAQSEISSKIYNDEVTQSITDKSNLKKSDQASLKLASDTTSKSKALVDAAEKSKGSSPGNESLQKSSTAAARAASNSSIDASANIASSNYSDKSTTTSGEINRRASESVLRVSSPSALYKGLTAVFSNARMELIDYSEVSTNDCGGNNEKITLKYITSEYGKLSIDQAIELTPETRKLVLKAAHDCDINFLGYGVAKIGIPQLNPTTGGRKVNVQVSAQVWRIPKTGLTRVVATVPETNLVGTGNDDSVAISNALAIASERVGQDLINRMSTWGIQ